MFHVLGFVDASKKNHLLLKHTLPSDAFNWALGKLSESALGKFTTSNLQVKFTRESPKNLFDHNSDPQIRIQRNLAI